MAFMKDAVEVTKAGGLRLLKLLVLSFWIGGGLVAGVITPLSVRSYFDVSRPEEAEKAEKVIRGILLWVSTSGIILGTVLFALLFFLERARRLTLISIGALVLLSVVNQYIVATWMQSLPIENPPNPTRETLHSVYLALFFAGMAIALALFVVLALWGEAAPRAARPPASPPASPPAAGRAPVSPAPPAPAPLSRGAEPGGAKLPAGSARPPEPPGRPSGTP